MSSKLDQARLSGILPYMATALGKKLAVEGSPSEPDLQWLHHLLFQYFDFLTWTGACRVFRAIDDQHSRIAACKVVNLFISPSLGYGTPNVKELQKEVQVHKSLKNDYILEFLHSEIVDKDREADGHVPGLYMLLELAIGGDLFDKIGKFTPSMARPLLNGDSPGHWRS